MKQGIKIIILTILISCSLTKKNDDILFIRPEITVDEIKIFDDRLLY